MQHTRTSSAVLFVLIALSGCASCGADSAPAVPVAQQQEEAAPAVSTMAAAVLSDADARILSPRLRAARRAPDEALRVAAYTALTRLHDPGAALLLRDGLRDAAPRVRRWAARGLGALGDAAPEAAERWLRLAFAAESEPAVRAALLEALGRVGSDDSSEAWLVGLGAQDVEVRVAACRGIAEAGRRGRTLRGEVLDSLLASATSDAGPDVVGSCVEAVGRLPGRNEQSEAIGRALADAVSSASSEVRRLAYRGLGRRHQGAPALLMGGASDADWRVAAAALGAISTREEIAFRAACGERMLAAGSVVWGAEDAGMSLHRLRAAAAGCARWARSDMVNAAAARALAQLASGEGSDLRGRAHCVLAGFIDAGRGWPNETQRCGLGFVGEEDRAIQSAQVLAAVPGADSERWAFLSHLGRGPRVREAIVEACGSLSTAGAKRFLLEALADSDRGVVDAALTVLLARSSVWARGGESGLQRIDAEELVGPLRTAHQTLSRLEDLEGLGLYVDVLGHLALAELDPTLDGLATHWNISVRSKAVSLLRSLGRPLPSDAHAAVPNPQQVILNRERLLPRVRIRTGRGEFVLELRPDAAPVTSARFLELVDRGFYTGLSFHRVVPGFVVQGGDPRGDGYGGPDFSQRCEDNELRYERGAVGMALAGRDTGGSQFFITYGAEPSLDGRYTIFARVASGMPTVDMLQPGDRMLEVSRVPEPSTGR